MMNTGKILLFSAACLLSGSTLAEKILFLDSYHEGYAWSNGMTESIQSTIGDAAELKIHRMDTKRNGTEADKLMETYVTTADEWKKAFSEMQSQVDILILDNNAGINDWNEEAMKAFVEENIKVPTGTVFDWMTPYCLIGYTKLASEQGEWAAQAAIQILNGKSPAEIGVTQNKQGKLYANLPLAKKLGATIPMATLKKATIVQ